MIRVVSALIAVLLAYGPPPPANAQTESEVVYLRFAPPLEQQLRYRISRTRMREGESRTSIVDQWAHFSRSDDGYLLVVRNLPLSDNGQRIEAPDEDTEDAGLTRFFIEPMTFELDGDGALLRMRNWPEAATAMRQSFAADETGKAAIEKIASLSAEEAAPLMLRAWAEILGYGGVEFEIDAEYEYELEGTSAILSSPIMTKGQLTLSRGATPDHLILSDVQTFDPQSMESAARGLIESVGDPNGKADQIEGSFANAGFRKITTIIFDVETGLPEEATMETIVRWQDEEQQASRTVLKRVK